MLNSTILDVAIGIVFCFASVALIVSAVNEGIASFLKLRHKDLLAGIKQLLNDPSGVGIVADLYNHALISPLATGTPAGTLPRVLPAYIPSQAFAVALLDTIQGVPGDIESVKTAVNSIKDPQLKKLLQGFIARADGRIDTLQTQIADWFDNAMDRLSGGYKRRAQLVTFLLGLAVAAAFNIDSVHVLTQLWSRPSMTAAITSPHVEKLMPAAEPASGAASHVAFGASDWADTFTTLKTLPVGWADDKANIFIGPRKTTDYIFYFVGLLITASSAVFGAPFWFDLLQRLVQIRGTGAKPPTDRDKNKVAVTSAATP